MEAVTAGMIVLKNVSKRYIIDGSAIDALRDVSLKINDGEFVTIAGRSGSGKTTLLRILAGLEEPSSGFVEIDGKKMPSVHALPVSMVFQEPRLMPWLSAAENVAFAYPPRLRCCDIKKQTVSMLETVGLKGYENAYPCQLSGGMAQRVALARALIRDPRCVLLDEPFGALDYFTRRSMQHELIALYLKNKKSFIMVTHDVWEAVSMGTRVVVLSEGGIKKELHIALPHPRRENSPELRRYFEETLETIGEN